MGTCEEGHDEPSEPVESPVPIKPLPVCSPPPPAPSITPASLPPTSDPVCCTIREHAGLERLGAKVNAGETLLPDQDLGQDVAFLAFAIEKLRAENKELKDTIGLGNMEFASTLSRLNGEIGKLTEDLSTMKELLRDAASHLSWTSSKVRPTERFILDVRATLEKIKGLLGI